MELDKLIVQLKKGNPKAQKELYDRYAPLLFSICKRYMKSHEDAEDVLIESLYNIISKINSFQNKGSFEGWMRRLTVNECLMKLRKQKLFLLSLDTAYDVSYDEDITSNISYQNLLKVLDELAPGYRTVFNLYVIEGYKHREIAEKLGISINTSKSQLILAKKKLREILKKKEYINQVS